MEYNLPSEIVKNLAFGDEAKSKVFAGVQKLTNAVKSTLGASGKCVIYEDAMGKPVVTKDGVTVANSVILEDSLENIGATLVKQAAQATVKEAGDGTTTSTVLAHSILNELATLPKEMTMRDARLEMDAALVKINRYLDSNKIDVEKEMLYQVATISANNDKELGELIGGAYEAVGNTGVVLMEESETEETFVEKVNGVQFDCGIKSPHLVTEKEKGTSTLENPYVLIVASEIPNIRKIQNVLEHCIKEKRSLLIVAPVAQQPFSALLMNKVKGNIKVNIVDLPGFGTTKRDTIEDLAIITGAKVIDEQLGDDLDLIDPSVLGAALKSVTDNNNTVITIPEMPQGALDRISVVEKSIADEKDGFIKKKLEQRLAMLTGAVSIVNVGANSKVELKEKKDRVEDAIYAVKAAIKEGIVPGGGVALLDASNNISVQGQAGMALMKAITAPYTTILENAGLEPEIISRRGWGINVATGKKCNMVKHGIVDPVLVTKAALKNAISVATTITSADCVISNVRDYASS